jgi:hypothetical protein
MRSSPGPAQADVRLRLTVIGAGRRGFRFLIRRKDGTVLEASSTSYSTEPAAQAAGLFVLRRYRDAANSTPLRKSG